MLMHVKHLAQYLSKHSSITIIMEHCITLLNLLICLPRNQIYVQVDATKTNKKTTEKYISWKKN